jgi:hypothetical protein
MTSSPDLIGKLRASRPSASLELRARVREIAAAQPKPKPSPWASWRLPGRRGVLVAVPAAVALAFATAGVVGLASSDGPSTPSLAQRDMAETFEAYPTQTPPSEAGKALDQALSAGSAAGNRAQKISATLTVEVPDSDAVSRAAQDALNLTRSLGGFVVTSSVATGEQGSASITVRVPVDKVQDAIAGLSGLGRIVSQQVTVEDRQEDIDAFQRRSRSLRSQIALMNARLESESLDAETRARLEARLKNLKADLRGARVSLDVLRSEARMSTVQLTVVTPGASGAVAPTSRLDRTIDEALNVLAWEGVIALALLIVLAPFALVALAAWVGRRLYRRHEEERLLAGQA